MLTISRLLTIYSDPSHTFPEASGKLSLSLPLPLPNLSGVHTLNFYVSFSQVSRISFSSARAMVLFAPYPAVPHGLAFYIRRWLIIAFDP